LIIFIHCVVVFSVVAIFAVSAALVITLVLVAITRQCRSLDTLFILILTPEIFWTFRCCQYTLCFKKPRP